MHLCMQHSWQQKTRLVLLWKPSVAALLLLIGRSSGGSGPAEVCISILCAEAGKTPLSSPVCHRVNDNSRHFNDLFSIYSKDTESNLPNPASVYNSVYAVSLNCVCMLCVYKRNRHPVRTLWMLPVFHKISCSFILSVLIPHFSECLCKNPKEWVILSSMQNIRCTPVFHHKLRPKTKCKRVFAN